MKNYSRQRETILEVIKNTRIHPTAENIYEMVKNIDSKISRSTVYRNLKLLVDEDLIKKITMPTGPDKFDYIHNPHNHVICSICEDIYDFEYNFYNKQLVEKIKKETGIETDLNCVSITGICEKCKSKNKI